MSEQIKVVLDTNVLISGVLFGGNPRKIIEHGMRGSIRICISGPIFDELKRVLQRPKFSFPPEIIQIISEELLHIADFVNPAVRLAVIPYDPADNRVLECAVESDADYIVSGDKHLLRLKTYQNIQIIEPAQFVSEILIE